MAKLKGWTTGELLPVTTYLTLYSYCYWHACFFLSAKLIIALVPGMPGWFIGPRKWPLHHQIPSKTKQIFLRTCKHNTHLNDFTAAFTSCHILLLLNWTNSCNHPLHVFASNVDSFAPFKMSSRLNAQTKFSHQLLLCVNAQQETGETNEPHY